MRVNELKQYKIVYTEAAEEDIFSKAEYIEKAYHDSGHRSKRIYHSYHISISHMMLVCGRAKASGNMFSEMILLYSVDEQNASVLIHASFTRGKNIAEDIWE